MQAPRPRRLTASRRLLTSTNTVTSFDAEPRPAARALVATPTRQPASRAEAEVDVLDVGAEHLVETADPRDAVRSHEQQRSAHPVAFVEGDRVVPRARRLGSPSAPRSAGVARGRGEDRADDADARIGAGNGAQLPKGVGPHLQVVRGDDHELGPGLRCQRTRESDVRATGVSGVVVRRDHLDARVECVRERSAPARGVVDHEAPDSDVFASEHAGRGSNAPIRCTPVDEVDVDQRRFELAQGSSDRSCGGAPERVIAFTPSTMLPSSHASPMGR